VRVTELVEHVPLEVLCRSRAWARAALLCAFMAAMMALAAQVRIPLPFTPVPLTLQVFAALLAAGLLGSRLGAASMAAYLLMGASGLPVFSGAKGGLAALFGPTGGYLVGFVICAFVVGWILERGVRSRWGTLAACLLGVALIHVPGWLWLGCWMGAGKSLAGAASAAFAAGVLPFIALDLVKALAASFLLRAALRSAPS